MEESRRALSRLFISLGMPFAVLVMVPLALMFALTFYINSVVTGFWLLCRGMPGWVLALRSKPGL